MKCEGTHAETRFRLSAKWKSPFKSAGASVQSTTASRGVLISGSNAGCNMFRDSVKSTGYWLPFHFPSRASPCAITFQLDSTIARISISAGMRAVSFTSRPIYDRGSSHRYPVDTRMGIGPQTRPGCCRKDTNFLPQTVIPRMSSSWSSQCTN